MFSPACHVPNETPIFSEIARFIAVNASVPKPQGTSHEIEKPIRRTPASMPATCIPLRIRRALSPA